MPPTTGLPLSQRAAAVVAAGLIAGLLSACGASSTSTPSASPGGVTILHPTGASDLVFRYEEVGGFVGPQALLGRYPLISMYGDGTVVTQGAVPAIFPGQALPALVTTKLSEAGIQRLLVAAGIAGLLGPDTQYDANGIADATTAQFTVVAAGSRHVVSAYALGMTTPDMEGGPAASAARARLRAFLEGVSDLRRTFGADVIGPDGAYAFGSIRILVRAGAPDSVDPAISRPPLAWPLATPLGTFGVPGTGAAAAFRCGVVTGVDLQTLRPLLAQATQITGWASGGSIYTLLLLPMLPDETGC